MSDRKIWVLVVDDNYSSRKLLAFKLHKDGFQVLLGKDGKQALEIIQFCTPDCILLDVLMPKMHGHTLLTKIREKNKSLPVIIMTGIEKQPKLVATIENLGISGWYTKPLDFKGISKRIKEIVVEESQPG